MWSGGSLFIIHYYNYTFNDQKVTVGGSILAICYGNKVVLYSLTMNNNFDNKIRSHCFTICALNHNLHQCNKNT